METEVVVASAGVGDERQGEARASLVFPFPPAGAVGNFARSKPAAGSQGERTGAVAGAERPVGQLGGQVIWWLSCGFEFEARLQNRRSTKGRFVLRGPERRNQSSCDLVQWMCVQIGFVQRQYRTHIKSFSELALNTVARAAAEVDLASPISGSG